MSKLTFSFTLEDDNGDEVVIEVAGKHDVCPECEGHGKVLCEGLRGVAFTHEDMSEAGPDFREDYMSGRYDVQCPECHGRRVVVVPDEQYMSDEQKAQLKSHYLQLEAEAQWAAEDAYTRRMESGGY